MELQELFLFKFTRLLTISLNLPSSQTLISTSVFQKAFCCSSVKAGASPIGDFQEAVAMSFTQDE